MNKLEQMQALVGRVTAEQLKYVDCHVNGGFGVFVPSVGFCEYAVMPQHTHPAYSGIIAPPESQGIIDSALVPGEHEYLAAFLPPEVPHEEEKQDKFQRYYALMIEKQRFERACNICAITPPQGEAWHDFLIPREVLAWVHQFIKECESGMKGWETAASHWADIILFAMLRQYAKAEAEPAAIYSGCVLETVIQYMHQNFDEPLTVAKLAERANMSESNFTRVFKLETGKTPGKYLHTVRLEKAKKLLRAGQHSITQTALACGFAEPSHFSRSFREEFGISPSAFRKG